MRERMERDRGLNGRRLAGLHHGEQLAPKPSDVRTLDANVRS
jgi:hypothetical protein